MIDSAFGPNSRRVNTVVRVELLLTTAVERRSIFPPHSPMDSECILFGRDIK